jgi:hypothetical protein
LRLYHLQLHAVKELLKLKDQQEINEDFGLELVQKEGDVQA